MTESEQTATMSGPAREAVIMMAVESWRFGKVFNRLLTKHNQTLLRMPL